VSSEFDIFPDEALTILEKFVEQTGKDFVNPNLRFSHLNSEREYFETARDFVDGLTVIQWGDGWMSFADMLAILKVNEASIVEKLNNTIRKKLKQFHRKLGRRRRIKVRIAFASLAQDEDWKLSFSSKLEAFGITPEFVGRREKVSFEEINDIDAYRDALRRFVDNIVGTVSRSDAVIIYFNRKSDSWEDLRFTVLMSYLLYIPVYILLGNKCSLDSVPAELLALCNKCFKTEEELLTSLREKVGKGRAKIGNKSK